MASLKVFDLLFRKHKNPVYEEAIASLDRVKDIVSKIEVTSPNVASQEIEIVKNKWVPISEPIGNGVHTMGLHLEDDYKSLLVHYQKNSWTSKHLHSKEWEILMVLDGEIEDNTTGIILKKGDVYIIPRNAVHNIITRDSECYLYVMFSSDQHNLKITGSEREFAKQMIGKNHSFKAK